MGWNFRGLYTADTAAARARLSADELVRGVWAEIPASAAPEALLPEPGLLVVHGFGPVVHALGLDVRNGVPWDAFWPAGPVGDTPAEIQRLDRHYRPPRNLVAWMREFAGAVGAPIALYQCAMHGGDIDVEIAVTCDADTTTVADRRSSPISPLLTMLQALGARPRQWQFPPHEQEFPAPLEPPAATVARLSPTLAFQGDDVSIVDDLLARGAELDDRSLCNAAGHGNPAIVDRLLRAGAPIGDSPFNPLGHAANPGCARLLAEAGAPIGGGALQLAAWRGFEATARYLVDLGAPVDHLKLWESAAQGGITFLVERALAEGAAVDKPRALHVGASNGHDAVVELLLDAGTPASAAAVDAAATGGHTGVLLSLLVCGGDPTGEGRDYTPLWRAAAGGHHDAVVLLLDAGADPGAACRGGVPLHAACSSGRLDVVELLLAARPDLVNSTAGLHPPLHDALAGGNPDVVALLLAHGADPDGTDRFGGSVRDYAAWTGVTLPATRTGPA
jgi:ankyrin repeat protein